nr:hypothetical protein [Acetobacter persici]
MLLAPAFLAACATGQGGRTAPQASDTARVEAWLRAAKLENVPFTQTWPNGRLAAGC